MTCVECKRHIAMIGGTLCYDCELALMIRVTQDEKNARTPAEGVLLGQMTFDEILKKEG